MSGCWDWYTNDPNGPADGSYNEIYGGGDSSGCGSSSAYQGDAVGSPGTSLDRGGGGGSGTASSTTDFYPFNDAIAAAANAAEGQSDRKYIPKGYDCHEGCVFTVNGIVHDATGKYLCSSSLSITDQIKACAQTALVSQATARPGDFIIVDALDGKNAHVGICLNMGCTKMNSNSSSRCSFTFNNFNFDYPRSPYTNGYITYWRMIK